mgnify:CR=1 FL=1
MTKRRKLYQEKRKRIRERESRAIQAVMRGVPPDAAIKYFRIFSAYAISTMRTLYMPKEKSWIEKCKENFLSKLNADVNKQYIKDFVSRSGTNER